MVCPILVPLPSTLASGLEFLQEDDEEYGQMRLHLGGCYFSTLLSLPSKVRLKIQEGLSHISIEELKKVQHALENNLYYGTLFMSYTI